MTATAPASKLSISKSKRLLTKNGWYRISISNTSYYYYYYYYVHLIHLLLYVYCLKINAECLCSYERSELDTNTHTCSATHTHHVPIHTFATDTHSLLTQIRLRSLAALPPPLISLPVYVCVCVRLGGEDVARCMFRWHKWFLQCMFSLG